MMFKNWVICAAVVSFAAFNHRWVTFLDHHMDTKKSALQEEPLYEHVLNYVHTRIKSRTGGSTGGTEHKVFLFSLKGNL